MQVVSEIFSCKHKEKLHLFIVEFRRCDPVQNRVCMCISLVFVPKLVFWYEYAKASLGTVFTRLGTPKASLGTRELA